MKIEEAKRIKEFARQWLSKVVAKRSDYRKRLIDVIDDLFPGEDGCDWYDICYCKDWDDGEPNTFGGGGQWSGLGDRLDDLIGRGEFYGLTEKAQNDIICAIHIACDLIIEQSGGVVGYTIGDLKKMYDGTIPEWICSLYETNLNDKPDSEGIWL